MTKTMRLRYRFCRAAQSGAIKPWMLIVLLLALAPLLTLGFYEGRKAYLDAKVMEMCAKDGGVKVYETVKLPPEKFNEWGQPAFRIPPKKNLRSSDGYYYEWDISYYRKGNPELSRYHFKLFRSQDSKLLGESISYGRGGGDLPSPAHGSSFSCPDDADITALETRVFILTKE
ncbi:hypothetical protein ACNQFN_22335 [Thauera butanivorans]|uniref:hypothetical protein n=1 Tax=Thauera butanivorans TaxID=86174 RepID=UPI003AB7EFAD